jgi:hypothetical protein
VQAEGLNGGSLLAVSLASQSVFTADPISTRARFDDAKNGLAGFALETGGQVFFGGADADFIATQILQDLTCIYLISFEPEGLPTDRSLRVSIYTNRPKLRVQHRARIFVRTAAGHLRSELTGAFVSAEGPSTGDDLHVVVIPTGFESGRYTTLVQTVVSSTLPSATWDLGITAVSKHRVRDSVSGRLAVNSPSPVVLEAVMSFPPGPYEITAVAHETTADRVIHQRIEGEWPEPGDASASIGPIALLQPARGAFLRDGEVRRHGSLGYAPAQWVQPERAAGLVGIICRGRGNKRPLTVTRRLSGDSAAEFDPLRIEPSEGRCAVFGDLIRENTMTSGKFTYEVRATGDEGELATGERSFFAVSPDDIQLAGQ